MKVSLFIAIVVLSGALAGVALGLVNLIIVEPYLDTAIGIENQNLFASGEEKDTPEFWANYYSYRAWQKGGQLFAGAILGTALGTLFGIVFAYAKNSLPGKNMIKKALVLSIIMWATLYVIPFAKYPANPPTVGDPDTIILRQSLYLTFMAISGLGALGFYQVYKKIDRKIIAFIGYSIMMAVVFFIMPQNPDPVQVDSGLLIGFRISSMVGMSVFWGVVAVILGALWQKTNPDRVSQTKYQ